MKIWKVESDVDNYRSFDMENEEESDDKINNYIIEGERVTEWEEINLIAQEGDDNPIGDYSNLWYATRPVVNQKTKNILETKFNDYIQFLPINYNGKIYYLMHVIQAVDAVDYENSIVKRFSNGLIMSVKKYVFKNIIKEFPIAKVYLNGIITKFSYFVTDEFKEVVEEYGLTGFLFDEVFEFEG